MGIQINGNTDTISAGDGSLVVAGAELPSVSTLSVGTGGTAITTTNTGLVGIGTVNPGDKLVVYGPVAIGASNAIDLASSTGARVPLRMVNDNGSLWTGGGMINETYGSFAPGYLGRYARGTAAVPSQVLANDRISFLVGSGFGTANFINSGAINIYAEENFTDSSSGVYINFQTCSIGSTIRTEKVRITANGEVQVGSAVTSGSVRVFSTFGDRYYYIRGDSTTDCGAIGARTSSNTVNTDALVWRPNGFVGIGTINPVVPFHLRRNNAEVGGTLLIEQAGVGDASIDFLLSGTRNWAVGVDNSDEDRFKLSSAAGLDSETRLQVKTDGHIILGRNTFVSNLENTNIGVAAGIASTAFQVFFSNGNSGFLRVKVQRNENGGDWTTSSTKLLHVTDFTEQGFIEYNPRGGIYGMAFGSGTNEWARFEDSGGKFQIGIQTSRQNYFNATTIPTKFHVEGAGDFPGRGVSQVFGTPAGEGPVHIFGKHRAGIGGTALVLNGDQLGIIDFQGADGSEFIESAYIGAVVDGIAGINSMPGRIIFGTTPSLGTNCTERARITSTGYFKASNIGAYHDSSSSGTFHEFRQSLIGSAALVITQSDASYTGNLIHASSTRANSTLFNLMVLETSTFTDREFALRGDGNAFADGTWTGGGADYAEYFEWSDGNLEEEDRRGISVVLDGDKIREAQPGEDPIGVISGNPSVVGDGAWNKWSGKYLRDDYGTYIREDHEVEDEDGNITIQQLRKLNPAYDPDQPYQSREERPEWDCVGLMGKLRIRKGQIIGSRWIKMRDISDSVEEWLVR